MVPLPPRWARGALCWPPCSRRAGSRTCTVWGRQLRWHRRRWLGTAFARSVVPPGAAGNRAAASAFRARHPVLLVVTGLPGAPRGLHQPWRAQQRLKAGPATVHYAPMRAKRHAVAHCRARGDHGPGLQAGEPPQPAAPSAWRAAGRCSPGTVGTRSPAVRTSWHGRMPGPRDNDMAPRGPLVALSWTRGRPAVAPALRRCSIRAGQISL